MAIEPRTSTCTICGGGIRRYPNQLDGGPATDDWAHLDRHDWIDNPHNPAPRPADLDAHIAHAENNTTEPEQDTPL